MLLFMQNPYYRSETWYPQTTFKRLDGVHASDAYNEKPTHQGALSAGNPAPDNASGTFSGILREEEDALNGK